jgi:L-threonylcarbamoyladenylate synthase
VGPGRRRARRRIGVRVRLTVILLAEGDRLSAAVEVRIREALLDDGLLIFPTDTLYALGGLALRAEAARHVRAAKGRDEGKPLPIVAADVDQVRSLCPAPSARAWALAHAFWPGPLTLILTAAPDVPETLTAGTGTLAVRVPDRELTRQLCRLAGPLISTSANRSGEPPPSTCAEAVAALAPLDVLALDGGAGTSRASTIVDVTGNLPRLLRPGPVPWEAVQRVWS